MAGVVRLHEIKRTCASCSLQELCLPLGVNEEDLKRLEQIIQRGRPLDKGRKLYHQGDPFVAIYAIRTGSVKSFTVGEDGNEQVTGFHFPGELIGLDAIANNHHDCTVMALETTNVCEIPYERLDELCETIHGLRHQLMRLLSKEIVNDQKLLLMLGKKTAEERLATMLLSLSARYSLRGYSATEFNLSMSRGDIANYLGLAVETVSRLFARFQQDGLLAVEGRNLKILDFSKLKFMVDGCEPPAKLTENRGPN